jgi:hypothetical protein
MFRLTVSAIFSICAHIAAASDLPTYSDPPKSPDEGAVLAHSHTDTERDWFWPYDVWSYFPLTIKVQSGAEGFGLWTRRNMGRLNTCRTMGHRIPDCEGLYARLNKSAPNTDELDLRQFDCRNQRFRIAYYGRDRTKMPGPWELVSSSPGASAIALQYCPDILNAAGEFKRQQEADIKRLTAENEELRLAVKTLMEKVGKERACDPPRRKGKLM